MAVVAPPPATIEADSYPGGLVSRLYVDGTLVTTHLLDDDASIDMAAEAETDLALDAAEAGSSVWAAVYDGDSGRLRSAVAFRLVDADPAPVPAPCGPGWEQLPLW